MFDPYWQPPTFETERLILRPFVEADADPLFLFAADPIVTRFTLWEHHETRDDTAMFVRDYARSRYAEGVPEPYAVVLKDDPAHRPLGSVGCFWASQPNRTMELGYWLAAPFWGRGLIAEACRPVVSYAFASYTVERVQARVIVGNTASVRVLEKLGFRYEGTLRSSLFRREMFEDVMIFAVLRNDWPQPTEPRTA